MKIVSEIVIIHIMLLATQAFYMYLANKKQMKSRRNLYIAALLPVIVFPVLMHYQGAYAYDLYEYSVIICIISAAIADVSYLLATGRNMMTGELMCSLDYSFFMICTAAAFLAAVAAPIRICTALITIGVVLFSVCMKNHSVKGLIPATALTVFSTGCAWLFVNLVLH